ncbi:MAG: DUF6798 domain-containing protein [Elusimicrobiota bacterium]
MIALLFGLSFGLSYGVSNHSTYLLSAFRATHPGLLGGDWLAAQTTPYHQAFHYLAVLLYKAGAAGWPFALANVLFAMIAALLLHRLAAGLTMRRTTLAVFLLLLGLNAATSTRSVAGSYLISHVFQPSTVATAGYLAGMLCFINGRYLLAGVSLGVGGLFHANFLALGFVWFGLAHLLLGKQRLFIRLAQNLGPSALAAIPLAPLILAVLGSPDAAVGREIFLTIRSPHHYVPLSNWPPFAAFAGAQIICLAVVWINGWSFPGPRPKSLALRALLLAAVVPVWISTLLTTVVYLPGVAAAYVWRLAPFGEVLVQLVILSWVAELLVKPREDSAWPRLANRLLVAGAALFFLTGCVYQLTTAQRKSILLRGFPPAQAELYAWARRTPVDSTFLIDPSIETFRLHARRAVVVDWKSTPILPAELLAWYDRIETVTGEPGVRDLAQAVRGYCRMDAARLEKIAHKYAVDYVLLRRIKDCLPPRGYDVVFANSYGVVVATGRRRSTSSRGASPPP